LGTLKAATLGEKSPTVTDDRAADAQCRIPHPETIHTRSILARALSLCPELVSNANPPPTSVEIAVEMLMKLVVEETCDRFAARRGGPRIGVNKTKVKSSAGNEEDVAVLFNYGFVLFLCHCRKEG
jgi:hypothetical protein